MKKIIFIAALFLILSAGYVYSADFCMGECRYCSDPCWFVTCSVHTDCYCEYTFEKPYGTSCGTNMICDGNGNCISSPPSCTDECIPGEMRCADAYSYEACGDYDGDGCLEWGGNYPCQPFDICSRGQCVDRGPGDCECSGKCQGDNCYVTDVVYDGCNSGYVPNCKVDYNNDYIICAGSGVSCPYQAPLAPQMGCECRNTQPCASNGRSCSSRSCCDTTSYCSNGYCCSTKCYWSAAVGSCVCPNQSIITERGTCDIAQTIFTGNPYQPRTGCWQNGVTQACCNVGYKYNVNGYYDWDSVIVLGSIN